MPSQTPAPRLEQLLVNLFSDDEFKAFACGRDPAGEVASAIRWRESQSEIVGQVVQWWWRRGLINGELFDRLLEVRPHREAEITAVRDLFVRASNPAAPRGPIRPRNRNRVFGRSAEIQLCLSYLNDPDKRLITIMGAPGVGKSTLAAAVTERLTQGQAPGDRIWWCSLKVCRERDEVVRALAWALRVELQDHHGVEHHLTQIADSLSERGEILLVLDHCDATAHHLRDILETLLFQVGGLRVLCTSTCSIEVIAAEHKVRLEGLAEDDAVALFNAIATAEHAQNAQTLEPDLIRELVRRVDRHPLAIGVLAGAVSSCPAETLLSEVDARAGDPAVDRALGTVWQMRTPAEQEFLAITSIFRRGFMPEACYHVTASEDHTSGMWRLIEVAMETSFLSCQPIPGASPHRRYDMLAPVRQFARARLGEMDKLAEARQRYITATLKLAQRHISQLTGPQWQLHFTILRTEVENLEDVLSLAEGEDRAQIALALDRIWALQGSFHRSTVALALALSGNHEMSPNTRVALLVARASALNFLSDRSEASRDLDRAVALLGDPVGTDLHAQVWRLRAVLKRKEGRRADAEGALREALRWAQVSGAPTTLGLTLSVQGDLAADEGQMRRACEIYREAIRQLERGGDRRALDLAHHNFAEHLQTFGDMEGARVHILAQLQGTRDRGARSAEAALLRSLGTVALDLGALADAERSLREAEELYKQLRIPGQVARAWICQALVDMDAERYAAAVERLERAAQQLEQLDDLRMMVLSLVNVVITHILAFNLPAARAVSQRIRALTTPHDPRTLVHLNGWEGALRGLEGDPDAGLALLDQAYTLCAPDDQTTRVMLDALRATLARAHTSAPLYEVPRREFERSSDVRFAARLLQQVRAAQNVSPVKKAAPPSP